jgi:hypothetical protein
MIGAFQPMRRLSIVKGPGDLHERGFVRLRYQPAKTYQNACRRSAPLRNDPLETDYRTVKGATPLPQSIAPEQNRRQLQRRHLSSFGLGPPCLLSCPDVCQANRTVLLPGFLNGFGCQRMPGELLLTRRRTGPNHENRGNSSAVKRCK